MTVTILRPLEMSDAGRARVLSIGQAHDLPDDIARGFIARGWAALCPEPATREVAAVSAPETGFRRQRGRR